MFRMAFALLAVAPQSGEQLKLSDPNTGMSVTVERSSVHATGNERSFTAKVLIPDDPRQLEMDLVAQCDKGRIVATEGRSYQDGKLTDSKDMRSTGAYLDEDDHDPDGEAMLAFVCAVPAG